MDAPPLADSPSADGPSADGPSVDPADVARFSAIAAEWWDPHGKFAPLHRFNPVRLSFIRDEVLDRFGRDRAARAPFEGLSLLDIGCGGGLLSEPMRRLGFAVTGVDASRRNIGTAGVHAQEAGLDIDYRCATAEQLLAEGAGPFDVVLNMEVVEHTADPGRFLRDTAALVAPGGLMIVATLNRTFKALALAKIGAEYILGWLPRGTHDWNRFLRPGEIRAYLEGAPVTVEGPFGVSYNPLADRWSLSADADVNYMMTVSRSPPMAKRRRLTPGVWMSGVFGVAILVGAAVVFSGWGKATAAPDDRGVCWRMTVREPKPDYVRQAKDVANLETCAAHLERLHLIHGQEVAGAYQGRFIFIDTGAIRSSTSLEGARWQVFFGPQRAALDAKLRQGGQTPQMFMMPSR